MASDGTVANRSEVARTGAIAAKFGTQPAIVRARPAVATATFTGFSGWSPIRTAKCGQRDHAFAPHRKNAGWSLRAKHLHARAPIPSPVTSSVRRGGIGAMATSILPSARSDSSVFRRPVHSIETAGASAREHASRRVKRVTAKSGAERRNIRRELAGSNACRGERTLVAPEDRQHLIHEFQRESSRLHAPAAFDQERVAKLIAQS